MVSSAASAAKLFQIFDRRSLGAAEPAIRPYTSTGPEPEQSMSVVSRWLFLAVVSLAPLPWASVDVPWEALWCCLLGVALALAPVGSLSRTHLKVLAGPILAFVGLVLVALLQVMLDPAPSVADPIWSRSQELLGQPLPHRIATSSSQWLSALGLPFAALLAFLCGFVNGVERPKSVFIMKVIAVSGALYAAYAVADVVVGAWGAIWTQRALNIPPLTGPFVNRNHAATYFGSCALIGLAFVLNRVEHVIRQGGTSVGGMAGAAMENKLGEAVFATMCVGLCLTATFLTLSRGGILVTIGTVGLTIGLFLYRLFTAHRLLPLIIGAAAFAGAMLLELSGGGIAFRLGSEGLFDQGRAQAYRSTLHMITDHPFFGTGLGTFADAFPQYRGDVASTQGVWDYAHSSPLQFAAEMGLPLAVAVAVVSGMIGAHLLRRTLKGGRASWVALAALGVFALGMLQSTVDFPLQIFGYSIVFSSVVGCGLARSVSERKRANLGSRSTENDSENALSAHAGLQLG